MPGVSKLISTKLFQINSVIVKDKTRAIIISINNHRSNALERSETSHWIQTVFTLRQSNNNCFVYKNSLYEKHGISIFTFLRNATGSKVHVVKFSDPVQLK